MIKANEIRIGNWVMINGRDFFEWEIQDWEVTNLDVVEPIHITAEILEKAGFKKYEGYYWSKIEDNLIIDITFDSEYSWSIDGIGDSTGSRYREIKYLHQLQNLYFALTGEELEVNL